MHSVGRVHLAHLVHTELQAGFPAPYELVCWLILRIPALGRRSRGSRVQDLIPLHTEFEDSLEYMRL